MDKSHPAAGRVLLTVDLSYQSYRASAANPGLTSGRFFTGGLYGFFVSISKVIREIDATNILICADSKPYLRSVEYPDYKANRKQNQNEELVKAHKQSLLLIKEVLQEIGIPVWEIPGYESDDLSGYATINLRHRFSRMYVASNDSDLFQLLWIPNLVIYHKNITESWTGELLQEKLGLTPEQFMLATALSGTHNGVEGIPQVGEVKSRNAAKDPQLLRAYREKHGQLIDRNLGLIKLPHPSLVRAKYPGWKTKDFDHRAVYRALGKYDIEVTYSMLDALNKVMK